MGAVRGRSLLQARGVGHPHHDRQSYVFDGRPTRTAEPTARLVEALSDRSKDSDALNFNSTDGVAARGTRDDHADRPPEAVGAARDRDVDGAF